jgi:metallo-beta-lactamase family protein
MVELLATSGRPAVVIAAAGMCTGGRVVNYLHAMLEDERHHILFVGYQAAGTPGRAIQQTGQGGHLELDGRCYTIRAGVDTIGGYSAHGDAQNLLDFVRGIEHPPREIRLVHGEPEARHALAASLKEMTGSHAVRIVPDV